MVDHAMWYAQNVVHFLRKDRLDLVRHHRSAKRGHGSVEQIIMSCSQLINEILPRYSIDRMLLMPSRRYYVGARKKATMEAGNASAARDHEKREGLKRTTPTEGEWALRQAEYSKALTKFEEQKAEISSLTCDMRIMKVILEESAVGQIGSATAFWSILKIGVLWSNLEAHLPFFYYFSRPALLALKARDKTKKPKKALSTEVTFSVKGLIAAFLKPRAQKQTDQELWHYEHTVKWCGRNTKEVPMAGSWCKNCKFAHVGGLLCFLEPKDARKFEVFCGFVRYNPHQALCGKWESTELMKVAEERHFGKEYAE